MFCDIWDKNEQGYGKNSINAKVEKDPPPIKPYSIFWQFKKQLNQIFENVFIVPVTFLVNITSTV